MTELPVNGVDADTGGYLFPGDTVETVAAVARGERPEERHVRALRKRDQQREPTFGVMFGFDPEDLASVGWAVVTTPASPVLDALRPLLDRRKSQAGALYRELVVEPGDDDGAFLRRHGAAPGPAEPTKIPYYLLFAGDPAELPFSLQYQLDVQYAVGRLHFDTLDEYAAYAAAVVVAEEAEPLPPGIHLFGVRNPDDRATTLSAAQLIAPLHKELTDHGVTVAADVAEQATKTRLAALLTEPHPGRVLFTASHGVGSAKPNMREIQGALLCQDWPGPMAAAPLSTDYYFAGADVVGPPTPDIVFSFACYGAGTPAAAEFPNGHDAGRAFVARLPQRLLAAGALAFVGHVDRVWSCSFLWQGMDPQIGAMASTLRAMVAGQRLGSAMEYLNQRYAAIATELVTRVDELRRTGRKIDDQALAALWTANTDARNYIVLGDPAVRLGAGKGP
ncbi:Twin-arginine translocation protein TatB [Alloactinosynnema sp. L-07]|uniref:hypothetical protein n=1 Tax=Alloactinosynnema sp. L-07 TaxID=1653480 RepID=UPI00065F0A9A|nr:hypothetical protein [Alloactinosynnema sp. L-07]CRK57427.1 Twin-arginine translocation protein TatB [Alloactinosynnema sp. L-07]